MKNKRVIIIGGEGNGSVIADAITDAKCDAEVAGFLNDLVKPGELIAGYPVFGALADIGRFIEEGYFFVFTIYRIDGQQQRIKLLRSLNIPQEQLFSFIHPQAYVASTAKIGKGTIIMPQVSISSEAVIGDCCLVMVNASVGHNTIIGDHCHLAAQCCISSRVFIKGGVHIGLNATVREHLTLNNFSTLGMGSVLLSNIGEKEIWAGNPARFLRNAE